MHSFFVEIVAGLEAVVSQRGYGLLLCSSGEDARKERAEIEMLRARQVDGIVLASANASGNTALLRDLTALGIALVMIDRDDHPRVKCHRVLTDDVEVGTAGHRASGGARVPRDRAHQGSADRPRAAPRGRLSPRDGGRRARRRTRRRSSTAASWKPTATARCSSCWRSRPRVDGVFAVNDPAAIGAMKAIWDAGLRVPEDVAVVGAGDVAYSDLIRVPLTTVRWSKGDVGRSAAELILDQIGGHGETRPRRVIIPPELVVRASA